MTTIDDLYTKIKLVEDSLTESEKELLRKVEELNDDGKVIPKIYRMKLGILYNSLKLWNITQ